jgi:hypothetical protein
VRAVVGKKDGKFGVERDGRVVWLLCCWGEMLSAQVELFSLLFKPGGVRPRRDYCYYKRLIV